jgi:hypothetical protein
MLRSSESVQDPLEGVLAPQLLLFENQFSRNPAERTALYAYRHDFERYWNSEKWLTLDFERGEPGVRASHYVGLMPFSHEGAKHLMMVGPKGCSFDTPGNPVGLLRFLDLAAVAAGNESIGDEQHGFSGAMAKEMFVTLLARHFSRLLKDLCRKDFRRDFQVEEGELCGRVRGRISVTAHLKNSLRGRAHRVLCRWEEFTSDNWDNRILLATCRSLQRRAAFLAPKAAEHVRALFEPIYPWFLDVQEVQLTAINFHKTRLWRNSTHYRKALDWARLILHGFGSPKTGDAAALVLNSSYIFELFAEVVTQAAVRRRRDWQFSKLSLRIFETGRGGKEPDLAIRELMSQRVIAVGDAKYKDVLDCDVAGTGLTSPENIEAKISSADWNQLYVYLRLAQAARGFFVVPFWNAELKPAQLIGHQQFTHSPLDLADSRSVQLAVLALNLLQPAELVRAHATDLLIDWLQG